MPGTWDSSEATEGGLRGITKINAKLSDVDEDIEGKFGLQEALHFYDVEVLESTDPVVLEDGKLTDWVKQSSRKGSVNIAMVKAWEEFAAANKLEWKGPDTFTDILITWEKIVVIEGNEEKSMSPGRAWVPQEIVEEEAPPKRPARKAKPKNEPETPAEPEVEPGEGESSSEATVVDEVLQTALLEAVGEEGATRDILRRVSVTKASLRTKTTDAGGIDAVLAALVEADVLVEDEGLYLKTVDEGAPF